MSYSQKDLEKAFNRAKVSLMTRKGTIFIQTVLFSLKHVFSDKTPNDQPNPTLCVNGVSMIINPDFFMNVLDQETRQSALVHETWHVCFKHVLHEKLRGNTRVKDGMDLKAWNYAGDYVINLVLKDAGFTVPSSWLLEEKFRGWHTEKVYEYLKQNPQMMQQPNQMTDDSSGNFVGDIQSPENDPNGNQGQGQGQQNQGGNTPSQGDKDAAQQAAAAKIDKMIIRANAQRMAMEGGSAAGNLPGEIGIHLDKLLNPKLPWNVILANYIDSMAKDDYTWRRPNRRFMPEYYLPSAYSDAMEHLAVAVDTSCSVTDEQFRNFLTEIQHIKNTVNPKLTTIVDFDTQVQKVHKLAQGDDVTSVTFHGRGGTDLYPMMDYFEKNKPKVLIVFSDLFCREVVKNPGFPVIWICVDNLNAHVNFGKLIHYDTKEC